MEHFENDQLVMVPHEAGEKWEFTCPVSMLAKYVVQEEVVMELSCWRRDSGIPSIKNVRFKVSGWDPILEQF